MQVTKQRSTYIISALLAFVAVWLVLMYTFGPQALVTLIGAENGYLVMFLVALFGGVSSLGAVSYVATLLTLTSGGLNPVYLAIASGLGVSVGDSVYFYLGKHGLRSLVSENGNAGVVRQKITAWTQQLTDWFDTKPQYVTYVGTYIIAAFTPVPNDILTIALGVTNRKYVPTIITLVLANMTHTYIIARFGQALLF